MALTNATTLADYGAGIGTQGTTLKVDANNKRVGVGTTNPQGPEGSLQVGTGITFFGNTGIVSAIGGKFSGDFTVGGVLTFEDVTNIDAVGIITAQSHVSIADSILHTGDTDTSIRFPSAGTFTVETNGSERLRIDSSGVIRSIGNTSGTYENLLLTDGTSNSTTKRFGINCVHYNTSEEDFTIIHGASSSSENVIKIGGNSSATTTNDATNIRFYTASDQTTTSSTERLRITSAGRVVVGDDTERNNYDNGSVTSNLLHVERTAASGNAGISICANAATAADVGAILYMGRTSATSNGGNNIVESGDLIGRISFQGADGSQLVEAASIKVDVDGTPGADDMPGRMEFHTTADGGSGSVERLRIDSSGNIRIMTSNGQLKWTASSGNDPFIRSIGSGQQSLEFNTGGSERLRITSAGRILKGLTTARDNFANNASGANVDFQIEGTDFPSSSLSLVRNSNDANDCSLIIGKTRATSTGGNTVVQAGDDLGDITFCGSDGTSLQHGANIVAEVQSGVGNDDMPTDLIFKTNAGTTSTTERLRIDSSGRVLIGSDTAQTLPTASRLQLTGSDFATSSIRMTRFESGTSGPSLIFVHSRGTESSPTILGQADEYGKIRFYGHDGTNTDALAAEIKANVDGTPGTEDVPGRLVFSTTADGADSVTERMRIDSAGNTMFGTTNNAVATQNTDLGTVVNGGNSGRIYATANSHHDFNITSDGEIIRFRSATNTEGAITVSGTTITYGQFCGSHWGRLEDSSKPEILPGTILETINKSVEWKVIEFTVDGVQKLQAYNGSEEIGASVTVEYEGVTYTGTVADEAPDSDALNKHVCVKVSDTAASKAVFGVFLGWDEGEDDKMIGVWNDMNIAAIGNYFIRIKSGQSLEIGDLIESDGTGCGVVQSDDIIRSKTVAKVTSTTSHKVYTDGSFLVTCVLYSG